jgi:hypothetical protein
VTTTIPTLFEHGDPGRVDAQTIADCIISECGGDLRAAVRCLVRMNCWLIRENRRLSQAVSPGYLRRPAERV